MTSFQASQGIPPTGSCDELTWSLLVESGWALGDRLLMLTAPNLRGEDVAELQRILARLGFDCGRVDGIYGPDTTAALQDLQRNSGLPDDGVCGPDTVSALDVLSRNTGSGPGVVMVREVAAVTSGRRSLGHLRIVIGEYGGLGALARQVTTALRQHSASATVIGDPDASTHAALANRYRADVYIGFEAANEPVSLIQYYAVPGFESAAGRSLSEQLAHDVRYPLRREDIEVIGARLPVLRETRMPAVLWRLGLISEIVAQTPTIVRGVVLAVERWVHDLNE